MAAGSTSAPPAASRDAARKTTFSFDSSGWMYVYHLGAAQYLQQHVLPRLPEDRCAFSGSSGGALVACSLCCGVDVEELTRFVIACQPECEFNPWRMLPCAQEAIDIFLPEGSHIAACNRLRVLVTRIELKLGRSLIRPQAVSAFASHEELGQTLRASCHIPLLGGMLPYQVRAQDGTSLGAFYDGLFWPSIFYTWRIFDEYDTLLKTSGFGWPTAHVTLPIPVPPHWLVLPPSQRTLWRLYAAGYDEMARYFANRDLAKTRRSPRNGSRRKGSSPSSAAAMLPPPSELPPAPRKRDRALLVLIILGWLHLLLLTVFAPLVPPYLALRNMARKPSPLETSRQHGADASGDATHGEQGAEPRRTTLQHIGRALIVVLTLVVWPIALLVLAARIFWARLDNAAPSLPFDELAYVSPPTSPARTRSQTPAAQTPKGARSPYMPPTDGDAERHTDIGVAPNRTARAAKEHAEPEGSAEVAAPLLPTGFVRSRIARASRDTSYFGSME